MTTYEVTVQDVFASATKFGEDGVLVENLSKVRSTAKNGAETHYIPILFKRENGTTCKLRLSFQSLIATSAALSKYAGDTTDYTIFSMRKIEADELKTSDYAAREKMTPAEQAVENAAAATRIAKFVAMTDETNNALLILSKSYNAVCAKLKAMTKDELKFNLRKNKDWKTNDMIKVCSLIQVVREDKENEIEVELDAPITRPRLYFDKATGLIASKSKWNDVSRKFEYQPCVFDLIEMTRAKTVTPIEARIKDGNRKVPLTKDNVSSFVSKFSLVKGELELDTITSTGTSGLSAHFSVRSLSVRHHKIMTGDTAISHAQLNELCDGVDMEAEEEEIVQTKATSPDLEVVDDVEYETSSDLGEDEEFDVENDILPEEISV